MLRDAIDAVGGRIHRRQLDDRLLDHVDAAERLGFLRAGRHLLDAAHQPVARAVEESAEGAVLLRDRAASNLSHSSAGQVVERVGVVHRGFSPDSPAPTSRTSPYRLPKTSALSVAGEPWESSNSRLHRAGAADRESASDHPNRVRAGSRRSSVAETARPLGW